LTQQSIIIMQSTNKYLKYLNDNYFREINFKQIESKINKNKKNGKKNTRI
jgi:hypothetical protein